MIKILISLLFSTLIGAAQSHFTLNLYKQKVYVGEPITVTLALESNSTEPLSKIRLIPFKPKGYEVLPFPSESTKQSVRHYLLIPHLPGTHSLPPQSIEIAHKDPHTYRNIWQTLQTLPVKITVLPLPAGINTVGNYTLKSTIDHQHIQTNKPLNLTLTIEGTGSLETVKALQLDLKGALVFGSKPHITGEIRKGIYRSTLTQTFAIIAEEDFTLPPLTWRYLNTDTGLIETLASPAYQIEVTKAAQEKHTLLYTGFILLGLCGGILLTLLTLRYRTRAKRPVSDLTKQVRKTTSDTKLYHLLLPHADNGAIAEILRKLEENIQQKAAHTIDRSQIAKLLE